MAGELQKLLLVVVVLLCSSNVEGKRQNDVIQENVGTGCMPIKCHLRCPYGDDGDGVDLNGCHTCNCRDLPRDYKVNYACPMPMCAQRCRYGRKITDTGCETCTCMASVSTP